MLQNPRNIFFKAREEIFRKLDKLGNFRFDEGTARNIVGAVLDKYGQQLDDDISNLNKQVDNGSVPRLHKK